jgi:hypothetical protein
MSAFDNYAIHPVQFSEGPLPERKDGQQTNLNALWQELKADIARQRRNNGSGRSQRKFFSLERRLRSETGG